MARSKKPDPPGDLPEGDEDPVFLEAEVDEASARLGVKEQYERNLDIVAMRVRGKPWSVIAAKHNLKVRRCQYIFAEWKSLNPTLRHHDPIDIVDELLYGYQAVLQDLAEDVDKAPPGSAQRVGANNSKLRAYREMAELLQAVGALPNDLGTLSLLVDGQITADRIITVLERHGVPEAVFDAILEALGGPIKELSSGESIDVDHEEMDDEDDGDPGDS